MVTVLFCSKIQQIISSFCSSLHIELQQRGVEFSQFFGKYSHLRGSLLERMPPMEIVRQSGDAHTNGDMESDVRSPDESPQHVASSDSVKSILICL